MKMLGKKLYYHQNEDGYTNKKAMKQKEKLQWINDLEEETLDDTDK